MAFRQIGQCLPQYLRQSADAAKTVQDLKAAFIRQQREAGHTVVENGDEVLVTADFSEVERRVMAQQQPSPTKAGNVRCMDCRCGGVGCPGMPPGYEQSLMDNW